MQATRQVSTFANAKDNQPQLQGLSLEEFREPEVVPDGYDKEKCPGWSPATFSGTRAKSNVVSASVLGFDLDKDTDKQPGLEPETVERLLQVLESWACSYAVHTTFTSGDYAPRVKLRVVLPLSRAVSAAEYVSLWDKYAQRLCVAPDPTRRGAEGLFFAPCVQEKHRGLFRSWVISDRPALPVGWNLNEARPYSGGKDWLQELRTTDSKDNTLFSAALVFGTRGVPLEEAWPLLEAALKENPSQVKDWSHARHTAERGHKQGVENAAKEADPLTQLTQQEQATPEQVEKAQKQLEIACKDVKKNPERIKNKAYTLGKLTPAKLSAEEVSKGLIRAWSAGAAVGNQAEIQQLVDTQIAAGAAAALKPKTGWQARLFKNDENGKIAASDENAYIVLSSHPQMEGVLGFNERTREVTLLREPPWEHSGEFPQPFEETSCYLVAEWVAKTLGVQTIGAKKTLEAVIAVANSNNFDLFRDYLNSLEWDGTARLDAWLIDCARAEDSLYTRAVSSKWVISAVARAFVPGCQVDTALILVGAQGVGKSSLLRELLPSIDFFTDSLPDINKPEVCYHLRRYVICELAELAGLGKKAAENVKHFVTGRAGAVRASYARLEKSNPRRSVLCGSTNQTAEYLTDTTGARRFWPVEVSTANLDWLQGVRDQLWAEAVVRYRTGAQWYLTEQESAEAVEKQEEASGTDPLEGMLSDYLEVGIPSEIMGKVEERDTVQDREDFESKKYKKIWVYPTQVNADKKLDFITLHQVCGLLGLETDGRGAGRAASLLIRLGFKKMPRLRAGIWRVSPWIKR